MRPVRLAWVAAAIALVPNPKCSGSPKPRLARVNFLTYTSPSALCTAMQTGELDIGLVPDNDLPVKPTSGPPSSPPPG